ncbi:PKD-like family lipoprotein [Gaetbulibacter saemankumensis]|uniref:PKD-like family lipoprotein n=1 Tax=Gaetbulibacter saemankumensis TaxID=311208 RepID=UPI00146B46E9|nr:PKD-like family lipoprotein [Gaetbulibacter saemankumensis]
MFRNITYKVLMTLAVFVAMFSCSEDLGNYDYSEINEVTFEGVESEYFGLLGEPFEIIPNLKFSQDMSGDESNYSYEWIAFQRGNVLPGDIKKDLAFTKNLQLEALQIPPAEYDVRYRVTDNSTGVQFSTSFRLHVQSTIYEGWMLLNDINGVARLDMVSKINDTYVPIYDVLAYTGSSLSLEGAPKDVTCFDYDQQFYGIYVTTEGNGTTKLHPESFDWQLDYNLSYEMLGDVPTDFGADLIERIGSQESLMYHDGDLYYYLRIFQYRYGVPINIVSGESTTFRASPFIGTGGFYGKNLLYDVDNKRFIQHAWGGKECNVMSPGTLFDYNTGKDLLYMRRSIYNGGEVFAILKDPADSKLYLARMSSSRGTITQTYYEEIPETIAVDMAQADYFAVSPDFGYIFYNVGGKVYEYDFSLKQTKLMIDKGSAEITVLKFQDDSKSFGGDTRSELVLASYDAASNEGTMELYEVPPVNGDLNLQASYVGFGRIVSISYRDR